MTETKDSFVSSFRHDLRIRKDVEVWLRPGDPERLEAVVSDRNSAQKNVWRAQIILATAEGCGTAEIMRWGRGLQTLRRALAAPL